MYGVKLRNHSSGIALGIQVWLSLYYNVCIYSSAHTFPPQLQLHWWRTSHVSSGQVLPGGYGLLHHMSSWILLSCASSSSLSHPSKYPWVFTQYCANKWGSIQHVMKYLYDNAVDERQSMYMFAISPIRSSQPFQCPLGYYSNESASTICEICPLGHQCSNQTIAPQPCPAGSIAATEGSTQCSEVRFGYLRKLHFIAVNWAHSNYEELFRDEWNYLYRLIPFMHLISLYILDSLMDNWFDDFLLISC